MCMYLSPHRLRVSSTGVCVRRALLLSCVVALCLLLSMTAVTGATQTDSAGFDAQNQMGVEDGSGDGSLQTLDEEEQTGEVTGTVSTQGGEELAEAELRLVNTSSDTVEQTTMSDSNGDYIFSSVEPGSYSIEAEFEGGEASVEVIVEEGETHDRDVELRPQEDYFTVSVEGTNSPVTEGEDVRIDVTVTNAGEDSGSQAVIAEAPELGDDADPVSLDGGSSETVSLSLPTEIGDAGEYTAEVRTNDDTEEVEFEVEARQRGIDVSILNTNSPVTEGEELTVEARVSNPGEASGSGTVTAEVVGGDLESDTQRFSLAGGAEETKSFEIQTESGDAGEYTVTVAVGTHEGDSTTVIVEEDTGGNGDGGNEEAEVPEVEVTEEADEFVRFTLTEDSDLDEAYLVFDDDWESARVIAGLDEGASVTVRTESAAERLLESEEILIPAGVSVGFDGLSLESREATNVDGVTCLYNHDGYTFRGTTVPANVDLPCHAPILRGAPEVDEGTGTPISLREGEYVLVGVIDGDETVLQSYTVESVNETDTSETDGTDADSGDGETETGGGNEAEDDDGSGDDVGEMLPFTIREIGIYLGMGAAALLGLAVLAAVSIFAVRRLRERDWGGDASDEEGGKQHVVLDMDSENDVYVSWSRMIERAGINDFRTKTPSEIAEEAKEAGLNPEAVDELTDVFEEVRYGEGEPTREQKERAKRAFERIEGNNRTE